MSAVLEQDSLFAALTPGHLVTVVPEVHGHVVETGSGVVHRQVTWFSWSCTCGGCSPVSTRWSHPDLAQSLAVRHASAAVAA